MPEKLDYHETVSIVRLEEPQKGRKRNCEPEEAKLPKVYRSRADVPEVDRSRFVHKKRK